MKRLIVAFSILAITAPAFSQDATALWRDVVRKCAQNDVLGSRLLYLGPSNDIGAGTIWRKTGFFRGYAVRWRLSDIEANANDRTTYIDPGQTTTCTGNAASTIKLDASVALNSKIYPVSADLSADLAKGRTTGVTVDSWRWEQIVEGPYDKKLRHISDSDLNDDINKPNRLVMSRALRVKGMNTDIKFDTNVGSDLKTKYDGKTIVIGGVTLSAKFTNETTLHLSSDQEFYLAGELRPLRQGNVSGTTSNIGQPANTTGGKARSELQRAH